jgi:hypothetical protein
MSVVIRGQRSRSRSNLKNRQKSHRKSSRSKKMRCFENDSGIFLGLGDIGGLIRQPLRIVIFVKIGVSYRRNLHRISLTCYKLC